MAVRASLFISIDRFLAEAKLFITVTAAGPQGAIVHKGKSMILTSGDAFQAGTHRGQGDIADKKKNDCQNQE
jgi:hypothetical protein